MGCPSEVDIGDNLTFSITTHDPDTGVLTDADAVPDYWVYEDETGVSINANTPDADVMAKLDDAHTTGFYAETLACIAGNGYEAGKTYTVYIEATVDSDKGGISYAFKAKRSDSGPGATTFVYTLTSTVDASPIPGADIWATTDIAGNNTVASGVTDALGQVTFYLDPATYYIWRQLAGWDFDNPDTEVVA